MNKLGHKCVFDNLDHCLVCENYRYSEGPNALAAAQQIVDVCGATLSETGKRILQNFAAKTLEGFTASVASERDRLRTLLAQANTLLGCTLPEIHDRRPELMAEVSAVLYAAKEVEHPPLPRSKQVTLKASIAKRDGRWAIEVMADDFLVERSVCQAFKTALTYARSWGVEPDLCLDDKTQEPR